MYSRTVLAAFVLTLGVSAPSVDAQRVALRGPRAFDGFTTHLTRRSAGGEFRVLTMDGVVHRAWRAPLPGWAFVQLVKPLPGGRVLGLIREDKGFRKMLVELDWDGALLWSYDGVHLGLDLHHDFERLPNGDTLLLAGMPRVVSWFRSEVVVDEVLVVVDRTGAVRWAWSTMDNAAELGLTHAEWDFLRQLPGANVFHTNSVQSLPPNRREADDGRFRAGNLLVSQRETNLVYIIDRGTGKVVWRFRGAVGQHHTRMIPGDLPGNGNILMMDNGGSSGAPPVQRGFSRALEIDPATKREVWSYGCSSGGAVACSTVPGTSFFTPFMGSSQRLSNGNTLIAESTTGRVFEVTRDGELVWEMFGSAGSSSYRAYRWPFGWPLSNVGPFAW